MNECCSWLVSNGETYVHVTRQFYQCVLPQPSRLHVFNNANCHWDIEVTASTAAHICAPLTPLPSSYLACLPLDKPLLTPAACSLLIPDPLTPLSGLSLFTKAVKCNH